MATKKGESRLIIQKISKINKGKNDQFSQNDQILIKTLIVIKGEKKVTAKNIK